MSTLFGNNISQTYQGLIKLADSTTGVTATTQSFQDGLGNNIPIQVSNTTVNISGSFLVNGQPVSIETGSFATTGSNTFIGNQTITGSVNVTGTITANSASFNYLETIYETASIIYSSGSNQLGDASDDTQTLWGTINIPSGSVNITGSLNVNGNTTISGSIIGGVLNGGLIKIQTEANRNGAVQFNITSSLPVSSSNIVMGQIGPSSTQSGSVVISGSNNIILNGYRTAAFPDRYGYMTNQNIVTTIPTLNTGSLIRPTVSNNQLNGNLVMNYITSSVGGGNINNNLIYGQINLNSQSGSVGYSNNYNNTTVTINQNTYNLTDNQTSLSSNVFGGTVVLNAISSSILATNNITFGTNTFVTNSYFNTGSNNYTEVRQNIIGGFGNHIQFGGNPSSNTSRLFTTNILGGINNVVNMDATGSNTNMFASLIYGQSLSVNPKAQIDGMAVLGKYNKTITGSTIFVVGSGTGTGDRRNAIEVTSNNETILSGSVRISGSLSINGVSPLLGTTGLITTGSAGGSQSITGSVQLGPPSNAGHSPSLIIGSFDNNNKAANITGSVGVSGSVNITGSLMLNGSPVGGSDRDGLITTGSASPNTQTISGSLLVTGGITGSIDKTGLITTGSVGQTQQYTGSLRLSSGSLLLDGGQDDVSIRDYFNRNALYKSEQLGKLIVGQSNMMDIDTQFGVVSGSINLFQFGGNTNAFSSGSNNTFFTSAPGLKSGSNNTFIGTSPSFSTGSGNFIIGGFDNTRFSGTEINSVFSIGTSTANSFIFKDGNNPTTIVGNATISGSLDITQGQLKITDYPITFSSSYAIGTANDVAINYTQGVGLGIRNGNIQIGREAGQNFLNTPDTAGNFLFGQYGGQSFESGSGNVFLHTGGSSFISGSNNTFVGRNYATITGGTSNVILGGYDAPETNISEYMSLGNSVNSFITKRTSQPIRMSESLTITGSLIVSGSAHKIVGNTTITGSLKSTSAISASLGLHAAGGSTSTTDYLNVGSNLQGNYIYANNFLSNSTLFLTPNGTANVVVQGSGAGGLRIASGFGIYNTGSYSQSGSLFNVNSPTINLTGSVAIQNVLTLEPITPLPSGKPTGSLAVSGSSLYFYNGTWTLIV